MADFKNAHLAWIKETKNFQPTVKLELPYLEVMTGLYSGQSGIDIPQSYAEILFIADKAWYKKCKKIARDIDKKVDQLEPTPNGLWFVTIGFNHDTWSIKDCVKCIEKLISMDWIIRAKANFELYRENGEHPHCHFLLETKEPKSRILDKLFRPLYTKKVVFSKNFIDVKPALEHHHKYIMLDKIFDKMENVKKDIEWRKKNNIPDFEKNWKL